MPRIVRNTLLYGGVLYALSLPAAFVAGGALLARPVKDPVEIQSLIDALDPAWDHSFIAGAREVEFPLGDRGRLKGTLFGGTSWATVIVLHASGENRVAMLPVAYALWESGLDVLVLDRRAHGSSDGEMLPLFAGEQDDLATVLDQLLADPRSGTARFALYGTRDAATSVLLAAATDARVDAVVADRPAPSAQDFVGAVLEERFAVPADWLTPQTFLAVCGMALLGGVDAAALDASARLAGVERPALVLGAADRQGAGARAVFELLPAAFADLAEPTDDAGRARAAVEFLQRQL